MPVNEPTPNERIRDDALMTVEAGNALISAMERSRSQLRATLEAYGIPDNMTEAALAPYGADAVAAAKSSNAAVLAALDRGIRRAVAESGKAPARPKRKLARNWV